MTIKKFKNVMIVPLSQKEVDTGLDRLQHAENLIKQINANKSARDNWLKLYGISNEAKYLRELEKLNKASSK